MMKSSRLLCLPFILLSASLAIAQSPSRPKAAPQPAQIIKDYKKLTCLTPKDYIVDWHLAILCRGADADEVKEAEKQNGPHAFGMVRVYVDSLVKKALKSNAKTFPVGAVIVKEKFLAYQAAWPQPAKKRRNGVTGMIKRAPGYDPKNGDWEYFIQEEGGKLETGKISTCVSCHQKAKGPDHLFATWYTQKTGK